MGFHIDSSESVDGGRIAPTLFWGRPQGLHIGAERYIMPLQRYHTICQLPIYLEPAQVAARLPAGDLAGSQEPVEAWLLLPEDHVMPVVPNVPTA